ncbi:MAG: glycoside hydrolase family 95 protein [Verrucomicrobia bacterium]|nr:glycoside hydrolase family 95 protein [Verrucomicrobiota bacterium]
MIKWVLLVTVFSAEIAFAVQGCGLRVWYDRAATSWDEALPLGNGRLGAMVFGGVDTEHLQLNEDTLYSGYPGSRDLPLDVRTDLPQVLEKIRAGQYADVESFVTRNWLGAVPAVYQPLGDLYLEFDHAGEPAHYRRELDLEQAVCRVEYQVDGVQFSREVFASHADQLIVMRLSADRKSALNFSIRLESIHPVVYETHAEGMLRMRGQMPDFVAKRKLETIEARGEVWKYSRLWNADGTRKPELATHVYRGEQGQGLRFCAVLNIQNCGGTITESDGTLRVEQADEVVLLFSAASSFNGFDKHPVREGTDEMALAVGRLDVVANRDYETLRRRHVEDYSALFNRVGLKLGEDRNQDLPVDRRFAAGDSAELAELLFHFGRYLMISGSREGTQPLNLQGIWNHHPVPPWASAYTLNINLQMNYWPANLCGLNECNEPLLRLIRELAANGQSVARDMYGLDGWVAHHNTTIWRGAQPVDHEAHTTYWPLGGGWLAQHLFRHYEYTGDRDFLENDAYPLMKSACEFFFGWLVRDASGQWITPLGTSPENRFNYIDENGQTRWGSIAPAPTMDMTIIRELFTNTLAASEILGRDETFRRELCARLNDLRGYRIGPDGALMEWSRPFENFEPAHRHYSHLYGLYPGSDITLEETPALAAAARKALDKRIAAAEADPDSDDTGWSQAWKTLFWAQLREGDLAEDVLLDMFSRYTLPNLLSSIYPLEKVAQGFPSFQIEANLGVTTAVAELLLQSRNGVIYLLPSLPTAWSAGEIHGMRARGGFAVDIRWANGRLVEARIHSLHGRELQVEYRGATVTIPLDAGGSVRFDENQFKCF